MFRDSLTLRMIYFKRIKYIMIQKENAKENKCYFPWRSFKTSNCLWKLNECKYYLASLLSARTYFSCFIKSFHSLYHHTPVSRLQWYIFDIDTDKNYLNSGYIKLVPSKNMYCKKKSSWAKICWPAITSRSLKHVNPCNIIWSIVKAKEIFLLFSSVSCIRTPNSLLHKSHLTNSLRINAMSFYLPTLLIFYWFRI